MKHITPIIAAAVCMLLVLSGPLDAQDRVRTTQATQQRALSIDLRGAYGFPIGDFSDDFGAESDFGFGAGATLMLSPSLGVYGGWSRDLFDCEICADGEEIRVDGWEGGLTFMVPTADWQMALTPWVRAGVIWHRTDLRFDVGDFQSERDLGFQAALGFDAPLGEWFAISPALRFNNLTPDFDLVTTPPFEVQAQETVRYLSLDLSARILVPRSW